MATYSDPQLVQILIKAGRRINRRLCLFGTADEITVDSTGEISSPTGDGALEDLVLLQAECLLASREYSLDLTSGSVGVRVVDGEQTVDTTQRAAARGTFFDSPYGPCAELEKAIILEKLGRSDGNAIW